MFSSIAIIHTHHPPLQEALLLATNLAETFQCGSGTQRFSKTLLRKKFQQLLRASSQDVLHQHALKCLLAARA
jgi:hypothetical protein